MAQELYNPGMNFAESSKYYNGMPRVGSYTGSNYVRQIMADKINQQNAELDRKRTNSIKTGDAIHNLYERIREAYNSGADPRTYMDDVRMVEQLYRDTYGQDLDWQKTILPEPNAWWTKNTDY